MTSQEIFLWKKIMGKQIKGAQFYRQKPIDPYIVDFYAKKPKLVIELDGSQHFKDEQMQKDQERDSYLKELRFDNLSIVSNGKGVWK